jgi:hypothetical protein
MVITKPVKPPAMIDKSLVKGPNSDIEELGARVEGHNLKQAE